MAQMTKTEFLELASIYGGNIEVWPSERRMDAHACLKSDESLELEIAAERELDVLLDRARIRVPPTISMSLLAAYDDHVQSATPHVDGADRLSDRLKDAYIRLLPDIPLWQSAFGTTCALVLGIAAGIFSTTLTSTDSDFIDAYDDYYQEAWIDQSLAHSGFEGEDA